jgi:hypothetical protein
MVTNVGKIPWPVNTQDSVKIAVGWRKKFENYGESRYAFALEQRFALFDVVYPKESLMVRIVLDPFRVLQADEIWLGMAHGKTWFYENGDSVIKVTIPSLNEEKRMGSALQKKSTWLLKEIGEYEGLIPATEKVQADDPGNDYRSSIRLLSYKSEDLIATGPNGALLDLEITNEGWTPWKSMLTRSETMEGKNSTTLGFLWFKKKSSKDAENLNYSKRILEERFYFPFEISRNETIRFQHRIGKMVIPGNYEV